MKILITGACGFVGCALAKAWLEAEPGLAVFGLDSLVRQGSETNREPLQRLGVKLFHGDIRIASDLEDIPPVEWVIDAAANPSVLAGFDGNSSSRQVMEHNLFGTINILEYCKRASAGLVLLSTSRVYSAGPLSRIAVELNGKAFRPAPGQLLPAGVTPAGVSESFSTTPPLSLYGSSKLASEQMALEYGEAFGFPVLINRCGVLAGAGQFGRADQGIFSYWINAWLRDLPLKYLGFGGKGHQVRDCLHPRDLVPLIKKQTAHGAEVPARVINLGGGVQNAMSLAELSAWCADRFGARTVTGIAETRRFDVPWLIMDSTLARDVWGWQPSTPLKDILEEIAFHAEGHPRWPEVSGLP